MESPDQSGSEIASRGVPDDVGIPSRRTMDQLREGEVPDWLRAMASVAWRLLVIVAVAVILALAVTRLRVVVIPLVLAMLISAVLAPPAKWLMGHGWPPLLATWLVVLIGAGTLTGIGWLLVPSFAGSLSDVGVAIGDAYDDIRSWLAEGPLGLDPATIDEAEAVVVERVQSVFENSVTSQATLIVEVVTSFVLTLVVAFFYIKDGPAFRAVVLRRFPEDLRPKVGDAITTGWSTLRSYLLGVVVVGLVDAVLIGIGLAIIGVPLVVPIMVLTFFAAFFPMVGAIFAGAIATLLALASQGLGDAMLVMGLTVVVQQFDGDVLAPLVYSRMVDLHPLAVLLALTAGAVLGGLLGAFLAVPVLAVAVAVRKAWVTAATPSPGAETTG